MQKENELGSIEKGKAADMVVLNQNYLKSILNQSLTPRLFTQSLPAKLFMMQNAEIKYRSSHTEPACADQLTV